jgi:hypothetical protein
VLACTDNSCAHVVVDLRQVRDELGEGIDPGLFR